MRVQEVLSEVTDHIRGMWRYRWYAVLTSWSLAILGWGYTYSLPNVYEASARVSVDTNSLLPGLTEGLTARENLMSEVDLVSKALLTRPNLEAVARETDLDLRAESTQEMETLITGLQRRVKVEGGADNIFKISFDDTDRSKARDVVSSLLNTFVESSLGAQGDDADMTERALALEIDDHEQRLLLAEQDLADFKIRNLGYMPDEGADYYTRLQAALAEINDVERDIRLERQKRDALLRQLEGEEPVFGLMPTDSPQAAESCSQSANIAQMERQLSELLVDFTEKHPRIIILRETIASLQEKCRTELASMPSYIPGGSASQQNLDTNPVYQSLRLQLSDTDIELVELRERHAGAQREVSQLRADVDKIAQVETELKRLNRDYGVISGRHQELLKRWETLASKKRLDPVTDQVQFNILEPPFAPATPASPNRPLLLIGVSILAIGVGAALAFSLNQLNPVFFTRHSIRSVTGLPVLGSVSMITSPDYIANRKRWAMLWVGANVSLVLMTFFVVAFQQPLSNALRVLLGGTNL